MTLETLVATLKKYRCAKEQAEADWFLALMDAESKHSKIWQAAGISTFHEFLSVYSLVKPHIYDEFVRGFKRLGTKAVKKHGAAFTAEVGKVREPSSKLLGEMKQRATAFREIEKVAPSSQTAERWRRDLDTPDNRPHRALRKVDEMSQLRAENAELKAKLKVATARIKTLESQLPRTRRRKDSKHRPTASA